MGNKRIGFRDWVGIKDSSLSVARQSSGGRSGKQRGYASRNSIVALLAEACRAAHAMTLGFG